MKQPASPLIQQFKAARRAAVPLIAITTPDPAATIQAISGCLKPDVPQIVWDIVEGMRSRSESRRVGYSGLDPQLAYILEGCMPVPISLRESIAAGERVTIIPDAPDGFC